jgi:UDP-glucose 4-epimerase
MYKKALVTGGAGFIGSHITEMLLMEGVETVVLDNFSTGRRENVPKGARVVEGDINDERILESVIKGMDIVFHNAALVSIRNSFDNFFNDLKTNLMGTAAILQAMAKNNVHKIIYASSMAVYADSQRLPIKENFPLDPASPYGISKLASERYCLLIGKYHDIDAICLRYFNTYGPRQTLTPYVGVITIFINRILKSQPPAIFGDGNQVRDFIYVKDVARANILAMKSSLKRGVFNIGTAKGTSVNQIAQLLLKKIGSRLNPIHVAPQAQEPGDSIADIKRAKEMLGFVPEDRLEDKITEVIEWWKNREIDI